jgi:hypothetical protein
MPRDPAIAFYADVFNHVWEGDRVPTPQQLAEWIESQRDRWDLDREWLETILGRLRAWPEGRNYPLIPDDEAVANGMAEEALWWEPGALRGDLAMKIRTPRP